MSGFRFRVLIPDVGPFKNFNSVYRTLLRERLNQSFLIQNVQSGTVNENLPLSELSESPQGYITTTFRQDYYNRIHINPPRLDLGNLVSTQTRTVEVWNAYTENQRLNRVTEKQSAGTEVLHPKEPPFNFRPLEALTYTIRVTLDGPPTINSRFQFDFESGSIAVNATGRRVVVWPFLPEREFDESLEWKTNILPSYETEQRLALRTKPRQTLRYQSQLTPQQFSRAKTFGREWAHRVFGVPLWAEASYLGTVEQGATVLHFDTQYADYRENGVLLVWESDTHFLASEVLAVGDSSIVLKSPLLKSFNTAHVTPLVLGTAPDGLQFQRHAHNTAFASTRFLVIDGAHYQDENLRFPQYLNRDVMTDNIVIQGSQNEVIERDIKSFDNQRGLMAIETEYNDSTQSRFMGWSLESRDELWQLKAWFQQLKGKQRAFWLPTWNDDLVVMEPIGATAAAITVNNTGFSLYYRANHLLLELKDGRQFYRKTLGCVENEDGHEVIGIDKALGELVPIKVIKRLAFLDLVRLDTDRIEFSYRLGGAVDIAVPVISARGQNVN